MMDINARVLAAFQVEHKEQLESMRGLLAHMERSAPPAASDLDEFFRLAHSLKAGARVCDLDQVETLAHRLETLFSRLRQGSLRLDSEILRLIRRLLDAIEDWAATPAPGNAPADPQELLEAVERLLAPASAPPPLSAADQDIAEQVRAAFQQEHKEYLEGMRTLLAEFADAPADGPQLEEIVRQAHSLKGAARVADLPAIADLGHRLETLFCGVRAGTLALTEEVRTGAHALLNAAEDWMAALAEQRTPPELTQVLRSVDPILHAEPPAAPTGETPALPAQESPARAAPQPLETVRLTTDSLDRLLRSSGQFLTEGLRQDQLGRELDRLTGQLGEWEKEWDAVRKAAATRLHRLSSRPEFGRVMRYLAFVEQQLHSVARQARRTRLLQRRSAWMLRLLGAQVHDDVRRARMVPAESVFQGFRKMMRDLARDEGKEVDFQMAGLAVLADRLVLQALKDPLMHLLRNAVSHGIESAPKRQQQGKKSMGQVALHLEAVGNRLRVEIEDDGRGIDFARVAEVALKRGLLTEAEVRERSRAELARLLFHPGFSTSRAVSDLSGRGMGLSVVEETVKRLQGEVEISPREAAGFGVVLSVPLSISTQRLLLVSCREQTFALPLHNLERLLRLKAAEVERLEGRPVITFQGRPIPLLSLAQLLSLEEPDLPEREGFLQVAVLKTGRRRLAVVVDAFLTEREGVIKDLDGPAAGLSGLTGAILLEDGSVCLVLNAAELVESYKPSARAPAVKAVAAPSEKVPSILVVDDSFTTRTLEKSILETHGYCVRVAVDGVEALNQLRAEKADLVIADVQMPRMDGFTLLGEIKKDPSLAAIPVIMVTSMDRREDRERGLSLGAEAYIIKRKFDHEDLLSTIRQIL